MWVNLSLTAAEIKSSINKEADGGESHVASERFLSFLGEENVHGRFCVDQ